MSSSAVFKYVDATYPSWDQNPEYIEACRTTPRMGDPTAYSPAHPSGASTTDVTSFKVGLAGWNENSLPDIMYQLWPCKAWKAFREGPKPGPKLDAQGNPLLERYPRPGQDPRTILDFPILRGIDKISTEVPWWFVEALFRLDPRLKWEDIDMLMEHVGKRLRQPNKRKFTNAFNNICSRGRQDWLMVSWREKSKGAKDNGARDRVLAALDQTQQSLNTTRGSTPGLDRFGNPVPPPTGRRQYNTTTARATKRNDTSRRKQSNHPSARTKKAAQSSRAKRLLDVEEEEEAVEEDDDDSDVVLDPIPQPASRPKRKHTSTIKYAVEDQSEDSAASEFEPDTGLNRSQSKAKRSHGDDESFENPHPSNQIMARKKELPDTKPDVQAKKKQRLAKRNDADKLLPDPFTQQPPPSRFDKISHDCKTRPQPRHIERVREHRSHRLAPHSTSSAAKALPTNPYAPQAVYRSTPSSISTYHDSYAPTIAQFSSNKTPNVVGNDKAGTSLPYDANGHGTYLPQSIYAPLESADMFEQDMLMHSRTGHMTSAFDHKYRAVDDVSQSFEEQGYFQSSLDIGQTQQWPLSQSNIKSFQQSHHGYETSHPALQSTVSRGDRYRSTLSHVLNEQQPDNLFNNGLALEHEPLRTYVSVPSSEPSTQVTTRSSGSSRRTSTHVTGRSSSMSNPHHHYGSSPFSQSPQDFCVSSNGGRTSAHAPAPSAVMPTLVPSEAIPASAIPRHFFAQEALETDIALSAHDLPGGSSDPASWDPDWESFFNTGADLV